MPQTESGKPDPCPTLACLETQRKLLSRRLKRDGFSDYVVEQAIGRVTIAAACRDKDHNPPNDSLAWIFGSVLEAARQVASREPPCAFCDPVLLTEVAGQDLADEMPEELCKALARLTDGQRDAVRLCVLYEMTLQQAAKELGCATSTVSRNRRLGLIELRIILVHRAARG